MLVHKLCNKLLFLPEEYKNQIVPFRKLQYLLFNILIDILFLYMYMFSIPHGLAFFILLFLRIINHRKDFQADLLN